jgi:hypothetical protein
MQKLSFQFLVMVALLIMNMGDVFGEYAPYKCSEYSCQSPTQNHCSTHAKIETVPPLYLKKSTCVNNGYAQDLNGNLTTCMYLCNDNKGYHCKCH